MIEYATRFPAMTAAALAAAAVSGCDAGVDAEPPPGSRTPEAAIQEAVIREMMPDGGTIGDVVVCIAIRRADADLHRNERVDPELDFLRRFGDAAEAVVPGSQCGLESPVGRMVHTPSGRQAVLYTVGTPTLLGPDAAEVRAGYSRASLNGESCTYGLIRRAGRWLVVSCRHQILSQGGRV